MPIYTYRCPAGHEWDEVRAIEGSEVSEDACPACREKYSGMVDGEAFLVAAFGKKVPPTGVSASFKGQGWTPKFYAGRKGK